MTEKRVRWGILGCGDVTEIKSGPALQKAARSEVVACMRRDGDRARDYAARHGIPRAYDDAAALIADAAVNAVYIATPPDSHAELAIAALGAGKPVLVEKPMALSLDECDAMADAAARGDVSLVVAYYRRALPRFEKMREIIATGGIGTPRCAEIRHFRPVEAATGQLWKLDPAVGGGGYFTDMQSHTLDWLDYVFGPARRVSGEVRRQAGAYPAEDFVSYTIGYDGIVASGLCAYAVGHAEESVTLHGSEGSVSMSFFTPSPVMLRRGGQETRFDLPDPPHVHQPMVERVVAHLLDGAPNPCPPEEARRSVAVIAALYA